jgi:hypothetical protein
MEPTAGIEPASPVWKTGAQPIYQAGAGEGGLEPPTGDLTGRCSTDLSYSPKRKSLCGALSVLLINNYIEERTIQMFTLTALPLFCGPRSENYLLK